MQFIFPEDRAYRDITRNGLTPRDPSPYPVNSNNDKRYKKAMLDLDKRRLPPAGPRP